MDCPPSYNDVMRLSTNVTPTPTGQPLETAASLPSNIGEASESQNDLRFKKWDEMAIKILILYRLKMNDQFNASKSLLEVDKLWNLILLRFIEEGYKDFSAHDLSEYWAVLYEIYKSIVNNASAIYDRNWIYFEPMDAVFGQQENLLRVSDRLANLTTNDSQVYPNETLTNTDSSKDALLSMDGASNVSNSQLNDPRTNRSNDYRPVDGNDTVITTQPTQIMTTTGIRRDYDNDSNKSENYFSLTCCWLCRDGCCKNNDPTPDVCYNEGPYRGTTCPYYMSESNGYYPYNKSDASKYSYQTGSLLSEDRSDNKDRNASRESNNLRYSSDAGNYNSGNDGVTYNLGNDRDVDSSYSYHRISHHGNVNSSGHHENNHHINHYSDAGNSSSHHGNNHHSDGGNSSSHNGNNHHSDGGNSSSHHGNSHHNSCHDDGNTVSHSAGHDDSGGGCYDSGGGGYDDGGGGGCYDSGGGGGYDD